MNLLHTLVATIIENFPAVLGALTDCFHLGVVLSYLTVFAGIASSGYFLLRRDSRRAS